MNDLIDNVAIPEKRNSTKNDSSKGTEWEVPMLGKFKTDDKGVGYMLGAATLIVATGYLCEKLDIKVSK